MTYVVQNVRSSELEPERKRALELNGSLYQSRPAWATKELRLIHSLAYRQGFALELLRDMEMKQGCPPIRSPEMLRAAGILVGAVIAQGTDFFSLTPARFVQSRPCEWYVLASQYPTLNTNLATFGTTPLAATIIGNLSQRIGLHIETVTPGVVGSLGTTVRWSLNNGTSFVPPYGNTIPATTTLQNLGNTGIQFSLASGTLAADNSWDAYLGMLADLSGLNSNVDFINTNTSTAPSYTASLAAVRNMATFNFARVRSSRFLNAYNPPPPGTSNLFFSMVVMVPASTLSATIFACSTVDNIRITQGNSPVMAHTAGNGQVQDLNYVPGTWYGTEWLFTNSTADRVKVNTQTITGTNTGNGDGTACCFGARTGGTLPADAQYASGGLWQGGDLTAGELAWLRAWKTVRFGVPQ